MPRITRRYLQPIDTSNATPLTPEAPKGQYSLVAGHTYVYIIPTEDTAFMSVQITGYTAALILTSATIQDCQHGPLEVLDTSVVVGEWITENPSTGFVGVGGAGWVATNSVLAVAGGAVGGALWHVAETGATRTRLIVVVGATGGLAMVSTSGK